MSHHVPSVHVIAVVPGSNQPVVIRRDVPVTQPSELKPGQCLVRMICTGVCHTDLHRSKSDWPTDATVTSLTGGHEGVGEIVAIADDDASPPTVKLGRRVGIKWIAYSCGDCDHCRRALEQHCPHARASGFNADGTFSQYVVSWVHHVTPIPESLDSFAAAPLLCAGVTVYRALKYSDARIGHWVVVQGAGGGLGHLAVQYAVAMGMRVIAIDTGAEKQTLCLELGAEKWIDFEETTDLVQEIKDACDGLGAHVAIVTSPRREGYARAVDYLRSAGTLMALGIPADATLDVSISWLVGKGISVRGSLVGNRQDAIEAMGIAAAGKVKVRYTVRNLTDLQQVFDDLEAGKIAGRVVLDVSK